MALIHCTSCRKLIEDTDKSCPYCGHNFELSTNSYFYEGKIFGLIGIVLSVAAFILPNSIGYVSIIAGLLTSLVGLMLDKKKLLSFIAMAVFALFAIMQSVPHPEKQAAVKSQPKSAVIIDPIQIAAQKRHQDSVDSIRVNIEPIRKINETTRILNKTDYSSYNYRYAEDVLKIYNTLKYNTQVFEEYEKSKNPKVVAEAKKFRRLCEQKQKVIFPILRKAYVKVLKDALWEDDIDVKYSGTTISFIGGKFAANRNIAEFHDIARDALVKIRFKRVNYKWYKYDEEYSYYTLYPGSDSDPVR